MERKQFLATTAFGAVLAASGLTNGSPAVASQAPTNAGKVYALNGTLLEACSCRTMCRCWIGEDPDGGACNAFAAYHIDKGQINGIDVSGLTYLQVVKIPGNVLVPKSWTRVTFLDGRGSADQRKAMLDAWHGKLGGPLADLNGLIKEDLAVYELPIDHKLAGGLGTVVVGDRIHATMQPYKSAYGKTTTLRDTVFSTIAGAPAYVSKATEHVVNIPEHGMVWTFKDHNAIQGDFGFSA